MGNIKELVTEQGPRAWVGCLTCDVQGELVGRWFEAAELMELESIDPAEVHGRATTHEEMWAFDSENYLDKYGEMSAAEAIRGAKLWAEVVELLGFDSDQVAAFAAWYSDSYPTGADLDAWELVRDFEDAFAGWYESWTVYAEDEAVDQWPELSHPAEGTLARYFDWDSFARDLRHDYTVVDCPTGGIWVFRVFKAAWGRVF